MNKNTLKFSLFIAWKTIFRYSAIPATLNIILSVLCGLTTPLLVLFTAMFIDSASEYVAGAVAGNRLLFSLALLFALQIFNAICNPLNNLAQTAVENKLRKQLRLLLLGKRARLEYKNIENHDTWDLVDRVASNLETDGFTQLNNNIAKSVRIIVQLAGTLIVLAAQVWWAALVIVVVTLPLIVFSLKRGRVLYEMYRKVSAMTRLMKYYSTILTNREAAAERILFGFTNTIDERFRQNHKKRTNLILKTITYETGYSKIGSTGLILCGLFMMIILLQPVADGRITVGMYISLTGVLMSVINSISWQIKYLMESFACNIEYFRDFSQFMNLGEQPGVLDVSGETLEFRSIEFRSVAFSYPGMQTKVFDNLNLIFERGKHYAVVGINGAGKSTMVKLMTGLYAVTGGEILLNGKNINKYSFRDLMSIYSIVYQDFAKYSVSLRDNICFGASGTGVAAAVTSAGLDELVAKLPEGIATQLGRLTDNGADISGGEWQKIAIARALFSRAPVKVLDEPTAALSPMAESEMFAMFAENTGYDTTIMISHRLGSTKLADCVLVFDKGGIAEQGSHTELMKKNGVYAEMFESQRSWYAEE